MAGAPLLPDFFQYIPRTDTSIYRKARRSSFKAKAAFFLVLPVRAGGFLLALELRRQLEVPGEWIIMRLKRGQVWRCINLGCGAEIQVVGDAGPEDGSNPRCTCGSIMKMHYTKPQFRRAEAPQEVKLHNGAPLRTSQ